MISIDIQSTSACDKLSSQKLLITCIQNEAIKYDKLHIEQSDFSYHFTP
mgnify:CR=1 FL=1